MKATIRSLKSFDIDDLESWVPTSDAWALGLRILAGPADGLGEESFDLTVCSLAWVAEQIRRDEIIDGRHHLLVQRYNWPTLRSYLEQRIRHYSGATWTEVAGKISRLGYWEFEDYQPYAG